MAIPLLSGKVFLVVTGASQGIGSQIAVTFGHLLKDSHVLLLARNADGLKATADKLPKNLTVNYESVDLSVATADVLEGILLKYLGKDGAKNFDNAVIVHNAASIGNVSKTTIEMTDCDEWRKYYDLNVFSPAVFNSVFMKMFNNETKTKKLVINITSLCCVQPMKSVGFYGSGKAAREMYFKIFALEFPEVNVLNYSPGPVDTEMFDHLITESGAPDLRAEFGELKKQNNILTTQQTIDRLVIVLKDQKYKSGDHVDYYDQL